MCNSYHHTNACESTSNFQCYILKNMGPKKLRKMWTSSTATECVKMLSLTYSVIPLFHIPHFLKQDENTGTNSITFKVLVINSIIFKIPIMTAVVYL